jgi:hypothetical protein
MGKGAGRKARGKRSPKARDKRSNRADQESARCARHGFQKLAVTIIGL